MPVAACTLSANLIMAPEIPKERRADELICRAQRHLWFIELRVPGLGPFRVEDIRQPRRRIGGARQS